MKFLVYVMPMILLAGWSKAQELNVMPFGEFQKLMAEKSNRTHIVNLWATWCKPCVEEMPHFIQAARELKDQPVDFYFVSVDFLSQTENVRKKIKDLGMTGLMFQFSEKGTDWIDALDPDWSGAIPYTFLVLPNGKRVGHYDAFPDYASLKNFIESNLQH